MKKRILTLLLAIVMVFGMMPLSAFTAMASDETVIYTNGTDGNTWPNRMHYVGTISLSGAQVDSYSWSGDACEVVLSSTTIKDASLTVSLTTVKQSNFALSTKINGTEGTSGSISLSDGEATVKIDAQFQGPGGGKGTKTIHLIVAGGAQNTKPARKESVSATASVDAYIGVPYLVNLSDIFEDADGDALIYSVQIGNKSAIAIAESYSYTPTKKDTEKLVFTASDGKADSEDTYTVTLNVKEGSIALDKTEAEVDLGSAFTLTATVVPEGASVTWSSDKESVATVVDGIITPVAKGTAVITASAAGKSVSCTITVNDPNELKAKVTFTIATGGTLKLVSENVTVTDINSDGMLSYDEALIAVHNAYYPGGAEAGYATLPGSFGIQVGKIWGVGDGNFANAMFYNNDVALQMNVGESYVQEGDRLYACSLKYETNWYDVYTYFDVTTKTVYNGEEFTLKLSGSSYMGGAVLFDDLQIGTWSDGAFAPISGKSFDSNGNVTLSFAKAGTYVVTAEGEYYDNGNLTPIMPPVCVVTVKPVEAESVELVDVGDTLKITINTTKTLSAKVLPANTVDKSVTWTSSDTSVATVSNGGKITAKKAGTTTITVTTKNGKSDSVVLTVELADPSAPADVTVTISKNGVLVMANASVTVTDLDSDGKLTMDEAMVAMHKEYHPDGAKAYGLNPDSGWVYKFWGEDTVDLAFLKNNKKAPTFINTLTVKEGDSLYVGFYTDISSWKDVYGMFTPSTITVKQGEEFELTLTGFPVLLDRVSATPVNGASVGTWENGVFTAIEDKTTDADGKVKLSFDTVGTYVVSANDVSSKTPLMAPVCMVTVEKAPPKPVALEVSGTYKTEYDEGEELNLSGMILTVVYDNGEPKNVELRDVTVSGYDKTKLGDQKLTIAYTGLTANVSVTVKRPAAVQNVEKLIDEIGTVTAFSYEKVKAARKAYDNLTEEQKASVGNLDKFTDAEKKLAEIYAAIANTNHKAIYDATGKYLISLGTPSVGSVGGEWMVIDLVRAGYTCSDGYYQSILDYVKEKINDKQQLHRSRSTDNSRIILALTAAGYDVTDVGGHNLLIGLSDFNYVKTQGINGPIWALIAFDSYNYEIPKNSDAEVQATRELLISYILERQLADGGWALSGEISDVDVTGMAMQALAPYYNTNPDVKEAIDKAIVCLSNKQLDNGGFGSIDGVSSESCAQVIVALTALGINPETDERFIKNGVSVVDALCLFALEEGGFEHIPNGGIDGMATEQAQYALVSYFRFLDGKTALYDMTDVVLIKDKEAAAKVEKLISKIGTVTLNSKSAIESARTTYNALTDKQKALVTNYELLTVAESTYAELLQGEANKDPDNDKENDDSQNENNEDKIKSPQTGDTSNIALWFALMLISLFALVVITFSNKKFIKANK